MEWKVIESYDQRIIKSPIFKIAFFYTLTFSGNIQKNPGLEMKNKILSIFHIFLYNVLTLSFPDDQTIS